MDEMPITREFINGRISFSVRTPKRKGIATLAVKIPLFYKEGRKSLTTIGFFKKSGDIFFGATSQKILTHTSEDFFIILCFSLLLAPIFLRAESAMILRTFSSFSFNKIGEVGNQLTRKINMSIY